MGKILDNNYKPFAGTKVKEPFYHSMRIFMRDYLNENKPDKYILNDLKINNEKFNDRVLNNDFFNNVGKIIAKLENKDKYKDIDLHLLL